MAARNPARSRNKFYSATNVGEFADRIEEIRFERFNFKRDDPWGPWFRGQQQASWSLLPKLFRDYGNAARRKKDHVEDEIREEFAARAPILSDELRTGSNPWDQYFLMQHFGAPTRLLDWTEAALVGLYFAVRNGEGHYDAAVWVLDPFALNLRVIKTLAVISPSDPGVPARLLKKVDRWLPRRSSRSAVLPDEPIAVFPTHVSRRISTQRSCFTVHGSERHCLETLKSKIDHFAIKVVIPSIHVRSMKRQLETLGIDEVTIFPDLDGLGRALCARWKLDSPTPPHVNVYTRLRSTGVEKKGVGVFAIRAIKKGTFLFAGDNPEMPWFDGKIFASQPKEIRELYEDFTVQKGELFGCPRSFNQLTVSWYLNEPDDGAEPNVRCDEETYEFFALRDIGKGEELTVVYSTYSD